MSLLSTTSTTTSTTLTRPKQYSLKLNMESSTLDKEERKREYNRLAQREFRRRRKEHLKTLEQAQKEQSTENAEEMERLRFQNEELRRENEALRAHIYSRSSSTSSHLISTPIINSRRYSLSPSVSGTSVSGANSPPTALAGSEMMTMGNISLASSVMPHSMHVYSDHSLSAPPYSMVHSSGIHHGSHSSSESSGLRSTRSPLGQSFHPVKAEVEPHSQRYDSDQPAMTMMASYDPDKVRLDIHKLFRPLLSDPDISTDPRRHLATLRSLAGILPGQLKPSKMQLENPHFYGIDLVTSSSLRDRLMTVAEDISIGLIQDLGILRPPVDGSQPITYWGHDPFNEVSWELSKPILDRWGWLLGSSWIQRANFWRRQRGSPLLPEW